MDAEQLIKLAKTYEEDCKIITTEETAKLCLVLPFLIALGYDNARPKELRAEYSADFSIKEKTKFPDRMDFVIFDKTGNKPLIIIETKPPKFDLKTAAPQLAKYFSQMKELHFAILTDGITYQIYGDLNNSHQMDNEPFFTFSLDDSKTDWIKVASFLSKFSRDSFNAETLITDAENSRYRQAMTDKIEKILRNPAKDEQFMGWLTTNIYNGKKTVKVMNTMKELAKEAIEPALYRVITDEVADKFIERIGAARKVGTESTGKTSEELPDDVMTVVGDNDLIPPVPPKGTITTDEELKFFEIVKEICIKSGYDEKNLIFRDTINYCNISYEKPTKWFIRYFGDAKRKHISTLIPTDEAIKILPGFNVEDAPTVFGVSRIFVNDIEQLRDFEKVILRSIEILIEGK